MPQKKKTKKTKKTTKPRRKPAPAPKPKSKRKKTKSQKEAQDKYYQTLFQNMKSVKKMIHDILKENYASRDNDGILMREVWKRQGVPKYSRFEALMNRIVSGEISGPETIRRTRQKWQEMKEDLRGDLYEVRHKAEVCFRQMSFNFG